LDNWDTNFSASPTRGAAPLTVHFSDQSTGTVDLRSWDFGDHSSSAKQNPTHIYNDNGTYTVILTVTGPFGSDTESKTNYINVKEMKAMPFVPLLLLDE
jgi:PKD repeat protein